MDHIRQRDWCSTRRHNEHFVDEQDIEHCVIEKIIRNKFWDPLISSDEDEPIGTIDWDSIFKKKNAKEHQFRRFVPGYRNLPPHPRLSALTQDEHRQFIKVLSAQNRSVLPAEFVGRPSKADNRIFEEKKEIYAAEQKEYVEWARHLWITTNCIRALRPKPTVEMVYEAEFKMKSHMMQCFPKTYRLAAQIPLQSSNQTFEVVLPKKDLIQVDTTNLPEVYYPDIYESKVTVLHACAVPEPCLQHPCKFKLPNETTESLLPLTEIHKELAQYALENDAVYIASENAIKCMLEMDRSWCLPVSVCEAIAADGDKSNVVVIGSEFPMKKDPAPVRSYRAFKHLLLKAFTSKSPRPRTFTNNSDDSTTTRTFNLRSRPSSAKNTAHTETQNNTHKSTERLRKTRATTDSVKAAITYTNTLRKINVQMEASDDSDDERLEIDLDDENEESEVFQFAAGNKTDKSSSQNTNGDRRNSTDPDIQPRKILKARTRRSINQQNGHENNHSGNLENNHNGKHENNHNGNHENNHNGNHENNHNGNNENNHNGNNENNHNGNHENNHNGDNENNHNGNDDNDMMDRHDNNNEKNENNMDEQIDMDLFNCVCKESEIDLLKPRSFKNWQIRNNKTKEQVNIIIHGSHKLKNDRSNDVILEPIVEYQLDIGGTMLSVEKLRSLAFSLMLRKNADLATVRLDGMNGDIVTIDIDNMKSFTSVHGDFKQDIANTIYTAANQLAGLLPGAYLLQHEPSHGANALLYARASPTTPGALTLLEAPAEGGGLAPGAEPPEEARVVQAAPPLAPVLLPYHKYRRQLPLAFTYDKSLVAKESTKPAVKKKPPPAAIHWPKKRGRKKNKRREAVS